MIKGFRKQAFWVVLFYSHYLKFYREIQGLNLNTKIFFSCIYCAEMY